MIVMMLDDKNNSIKIMDMLRRKKKVTRQASGFGSLWYPSSRVHTWPKQSDF